MMDTCSIFVFNMFIDSELAETNMGQCSVGIDGVKVGRAGLYSLSFLFFVLFNFCPPLSRRTRSSPGNSLLRGIQVYHVSAFMWVYPLLMEIPQVCRDLSDAVKWAAEVE